jgi:hypothetical protein
MKKTMKIIEIFHKNEVDGKKDKIHKKKFLKT